MQPQGEVDPLMHAQLDVGEAAVISLALRENIDVVLIDERKARKIARLVYGLKVIGTTRLLIESKRAGLIDNVEAVIHVMRQNGYWIHDNIVQFALRIAGEK